MWDWHIAHRGQSQLPAAKTAKPNPLVPGKLAAWRAQEEVKCRPAAPSILTPCGKTQHPGCSPSLPHLLPIWSRRFRKVLGSPLSAPSARTPAWAPPLGEEPNNAACYHLCKQWVPSHSATLHFCLGPGQEGRCWLLCLHPEPAKGGSCALHLIALLTICKWGSSKWGSWEAEISSEFMLYLPLSK